MASATTPTRELLPRWPVGALFVAYPIWWLLGVVDVMWMGLAAVMVLYLTMASGLRVPRSFGWWLLFLAWSAASVVMLTSAGAVMGFAYRYGIYVACGVLFVYVYNARRTLTERYVTGCLSAWWLTTVAGGYLGVLLPNGVLRTPMSDLLPPSLVANDLVNHMVVRRFAQYNPDSFLGVAPRPSAPFLYTNNWGNVFSLLLPFVLVYLTHVSGWRRRLLLVALPLSAVPALLTLNRGMFLGLAVGLVYATLRLAVRGNVRAIVSLVLVAVVGFALFEALPVQERLQGRLSDAATATSNDTRASLYLQAIQLVPESPVFGFGAPQAGDNPIAAPVGTQGQIWLLLVSHGPVATAAYVLFFLSVLWRAWRRTDATGLAAQTVLVVGILELAYYGMVPNGLPIMMVAAALAARGSDRGAVPPRHRAPARTSAPTA